MGSMRLLNGIYYGLTLSENATLSGTVMGDVRVQAGVHCIVEGMVSGDVIVDAGASARIDGIVNGLIVNHGGSVAVRGIVGDMIVHKSSGTAAGGDPDHFPGAYRQAGEA
jgi:hypothetical protein